MTDLLLDTNIVIASVNNARDRLPPRLASAIDESQNRLAVSVASLWEIVIKHRLGKLDLRVAPDRIPAFLTGSNVAILPVEANHALANSAPVPATKDPFDRLLLAICAAEAMKLVTIDQRLTGHPLVY